jgi:BioD-like phosphotransacetylase family protein
MKLYIASTSSFSGKTLLALALGTIWGEAGVKVGYVKPLGKIPVMREGRLVDEDAAFLADALALEAPLDAVCPVVITQDLMMAAWRGEELRLRGRISAAVHDAEARSEVLLVGGTANLRDGIFLGLSPVEFIVNYDCRVVLIDRFDGEKSMDQVLSAVETLGPRFLGVVFNRVKPSQEKFVRETVIPFFGARGVRVLGVIPLDPVLGSVSVRALADSLSATFVCGGEDSGKGMIERFCVGAMDVENALRVFRRISRKAVVTGGYRTDIQLAALETDTVCLVLTGGVAPNELIQARAREKGVAILTVAEDTMTTVDRFENLLGRLRIREPEKIRRGIDLLRSSVDTAGLLSLCRLTP